MDLEVRVFGVFGDYRVTVERQVRLYCREHGSGFLIRTVKHVLAGGRDDLPYRVFLGVLFPIAELLVVNHFLPQFFHVLA